MFSHIYTNVFLGCMWKWYSGSACCKIFGYLVGMANLYNYPVKQHENHTRKPPAIIDIDHHHLSSSRLPRFMLAYRFLCLPIVVKILWPCLTRYPAARECTICIILWEIPKHTICILLWEIPRQTNIRSALQHPPKPPFSLKCRVLKNHQLFWIFGQHFLDIFPCW